MTRLSTRALAPITLAVASLWAVSGCSRDTLTESWQLDRLRILGVAADPAEPRPGEQTTFRSLIYTPEGVLLEGVIWFGCLPESATDFGCEMDPGIMDTLSEADPSTMSPEELAALYQEAVDAGLIGFEPLISPVWTPPEDALDGLSEAQALEGLSAMINITAIPQGAQNDGDVELAYKRVPVSLAITPNHNPEITTLHVDATEVAPGEAFIAQPGQTYQIEPILPDDAIEDYVYTNSDGQQEDRTEEPYFTWYTEGGGFDQAYSLYPYNAVDWTAPWRPFDGLIVTVMRDRRGGMAWSSLHMIVEQEP